MLCDRAAASLAEKNSILTLACGTVFGIHGRVWISALEADCRWVVELNSILGNTVSISLRAKVGTDLEALLCHKDRLIQDQGILQTGSTF